MRLGILLLIMALATEVFADPRMWEPTGRMIRGEAPVSLGATATNTNGYTLLVWVDYETGAGDIWGQLLDLSSIPQWGEHGRRLVGTDMKESGIMVAPWQDGFILGFARAVSPNSRGGLFLCPIDLEGNPVWPQNNGTGVLASPEQLHGCKFKQILTIEDGIAVYTFEGYNPSGDTLIAYVNWCDAFGTIQWDTSLEFIGNGRFYSGLNGLAASFASGIYVARKEVEDSSQHYKLQNFEFGGQLNWELELPEENYFPSYSPMVLIRGEGCFFSYVDYSATPRRYLLQKIDSSGFPQWTESLVLSNDWSYKSSLGLKPSIELGDTTGLLAYWYHYANGSNDTSVAYAQKITFDGEILWQPEGLSFCRMSGYDSYDPLSFASDHVGGLLTMSRTVEWVNDELRRIVSLSRITAAGGADWGDSCRIRLLLDSREGSSYVSTFTLEVGESRNALFTWSSPSNDNFVQTKLVDKVSGETREPPGVQTWASGNAQNCNNLNAIGLTNGNAALCWIEGGSSSNTEARVYYQIVTPNGNLLPETIGRQFSQEGVQTSANFDVCPDRTGGFYLIRSAYISNNGRRISGTRIRADGTQVGDSGGIQIDFQGGYAPSSSVRCIPDGTGRVFFVWQREEIGAYGTFMQRFDSSLSSIGTPLRLSPTSQYHVLCSISPTVEGGCVVMTSRNGILYAKKINADLQIVWTVQVCETVYDPQVANAVELPTGEVVVAWTDHRPDNSGRTVLYAQGFSVDGVERFVHGGILLADSVETMEMVQTTIGQPVVVYRKEGPFSFFFSTAYAMALNIDLESVWGDQGIELSTVCDWGDGYELKGVVADDSGGVFVAYNACLSSEYELRAVHLNSEGVSTDEYWVENGGIVCNEPSFKRTVVVASGIDHNKFYCFWEDNRNYSQIFGQYIDETSTSVNPPRAPIVSQITLSQNYPNPFNANTEIAFSLPHAMGAMLQVYDVTGRLVRTLADQHFIAGEHRIAFDASGLASGIYFYELRAGDTKVARKMLLLK